MTVIAICWIALMVLIIVACHSLTHREKKEQKHGMRFTTMSPEIFTLMCSEDYEPFNIESEALKLQEEREKQEPYLITLWWGFDGLRLNADGSTEWISRRKEKTGLQSVVQSIYNSQMQSAQIKETEDKLRELQAKRLVPCYSDFPTDIDKRPKKICELKHIDGYCVVDDTPDFGNTQKFIFDALQSDCVERLIQAQLPSAAACQHTASQNALYAQYQNAPILPV